MTEYLIFAGILIAGLAITFGVIQARSKSSSGTQITLLIVLAAGWAALAGFWLGKSGINWQTGLIAFATTLLVSGGLTWLAVRKYLQPVQTIQEMMRALLEGKADTSRALAAQSEFKALAADFTQYQERQKILMDSLQAVSQLDFSHEIPQISEQDDMVSQLAGFQSQFRNLVEELSQKLEILQTSSSQLANDSRLSRESSRQIAQTIEQVAQAITQQAAAINTTANSISILNKGVENINQGIVNQGNALSESVIYFQDLNTSVTDLAEFARLTNESAAQEVKTADQGVATVQQTLNGMEQIKAKVVDTATKVQDLVRTSQTINEITETIDDIASQTNLLALNAAIEAARASSQANILTEELLNRQMIIEARLVNQILMTGNSFSQKFWETAAREADLDTICITDEDGVIQYSDDASQIGWRFSEDPKDQTAAFRPLLKQTDGVVCQPPARRGVDNKVFKYVGVSRKDQRGIVQVGFNAESLNKFQLQVGGFAVVASEVYRLAENTKSSAKEIAGHIREEQKILSLVTEAMKDSVSQVEDGMILANNAGKALQDIISASQEVTAQSSKTANETVNLKNTTEKLMGRMVVVNDVVDDNRKAASSMTQSATAVAEAIENIASISQENSAAVEEVSATTNDVSEQVEDVFHSAEGIQNLSAEFAAILKQVKINE